MVDTSKLYSEEAQKNALAGKRGFTWEGVVLEERRVALNKKIRRRQELFRRYPRLEDPIVREQYNRLRSPEYLEYLRNQARQTPDLPWAAPSEHVPDRVVLKMYQLDDEINEILRLNSADESKSPLEQDTNHGSANRQGATGDRKRLRESFVRPILDKKGWSVLDWATDSDVDYHTANDYLNGQTKPYASTRIKLAGSLGVDVEMLPL